MSAPYVTRAFVSRESGEHYACMATKRGFKCGICNRGNLTLAPKVGQRCNCCHNRVSQVILSTDVTFPFSPELYA
jgi:hypothetical protein